MSVEANYIFILRARSGRGTEVFSRRILKGSWRLSSARAST